MSRVAWRPSSMPQLNGTHSLQVFLCLWALFDGRGGGGNLTPVGGGGGQFNPGRLFSIKEWDSGPFTCCGAAPVPLFPSSRDPACQPVMDDASAPKLP